MERVESIPTDETAQQGFTLVFLHYFGGAAQSWHWVIKELETDFTCFPVNLPGYGGTTELSAPSIAAYAQHIASEIKSAGIGNCILIGHSMGGKLALQCAIDHKTECIKSLILVAPSPPSIERMSGDQQNEMRKDPDEDAAKQSVLKAICLELDKEKMNLAISTPQQVASKARKWWIDEGIHCSIADQCQKLTLPIDVMIAGQDPAITMEMTTEDTLPNLPPHADVKIHPASGHLIPLEDPQWLAKEIRSSIRKLIET